MIRISTAVTLLFFYPNFSQAENQNYFQKAIESAEKHLPEERVKITSDKFQYLNELSLDPSCPDTFHVVDLRVLIDRYQLWQQYLPNVTPYYAVKTNNDMVIAAVLSSLGTGFDCASENEIKQVLELDVDPSKIIFAHPRKPDRSILYAKKAGVHLVTFDSIEELDKMITLYPEANLLLRIKTDDSMSSSPLSEKFGVTVTEAYDILEEGFTKGANIKGIAFHVGSNCTHLESYRKALVDAAELFRFSKNHLNQELSILDLGGGWPGTNDDSFIAIAEVVQDLIKSHFNPETHFIAEPGRYFAAKTTTLAMKVIGKKRSKEEKKIAYYLSNGVFGFFISSLYYEYNLEKILSEGWLIKPLANNSSTTYPSLLWGPTCDSGDKILDEISLPELATGEFLVVENLGAYSKSLETSFNGIPLSKAYYIWDLPPEN